MKIKRALFISLTFNFLFSIVFLALAIIYRDKLFQGMIRLHGKPRIVMYGNSITAQGKWVELLQRADVLNSGMPGQSTYHFVQLINPMVVDFHPEICFVMGGINDITVGVSQQKLQANYMLILETLLKNQITPVVTLTLYEQNDPVSKAEIDTLNDFLVQFCQNNKIEYLDMNQFLCDSSGLMQKYARDKTHLNEEAYKVWAGEIGTILRRRGL